eukprot:3730284-Pleurochrysis_carterae.AAC.1
MATRERKFIAAAVKGRRAVDIVAALHSAGGSKLLFDIASTQPFQVVVHDIVKTAASRIQEHWSARHSLH